MSRTPSIMARTYRFIFKLAPLGASIVALNYLLAAVVPPLAAYLSVNLLDGAYRLSTGEGAAEVVYLFGIASFAMYLINDFYYAFSSGYTNSAVYERCVHALRINLIEKMSRMPLIAFEDAALLDKRNRALDAVDREQPSSLFMYGIQTASSLMGILGTIGVVSAYSLWLMPILLLSVLPYLIARLIRGKEFFYVKSAQSKRMRAHDYLWGLFTDVKVAKETRSMGFGAFLTRKYLLLMRGMDEELWAQRDKDTRLLLLCDIIRGVGYGGALAALLGLVLNGAISPGVFGAAIGAFLGAQSSFRGFLEWLGRIPEYARFTKNVFDMLDMPDAPDGERPFTGIERSIELHDVSFRYPNAQTDALCGVNLSLERGKRYAVVGRNGGGKTTLSKVLLGLYAPSGGSVLWDGVPVYAYRQADLHARTVIVAQDFTRFQTTLRENVAISDVARMDNDAAVMSALDGAGLGDLANEIGLDAPLSTAYGGRELSGGQWQRLAIAQALFRDSEVVVLDEPTSALDPVVEADILRSFIDLSDGKTTVIISHRVGLCRYVDVVIVMEGGRVAEMGSHEALMRKGGTYAVMFNEQARWYA